MEERERGERENIGKVNRQAEHYKALGRMF